MLKIRQEQWDAFAECSRQDYVNRTYVKMGELWPEECAKLGEEATRTRIRLGLARAQEYGIKLEPDVNVYINMMFMWGDDFDTSPETPWAGQVLAWDCPGPTKARGLARHSEAALEARLSEL